MKLIIDIPQDVEARVLNAFAGRYGWSELAPVGESSASNLAMSQVEFLTFHILRFVQSQTVAWEGEQAGSMAEKQARTKAESEIHLTGTAQIPNST